MANFISLTDPSGTELNINADYIVMYLKSSETLVGDSMVITTIDKFQVMETPDQIDELLNREKRINNNENPV